MLKSCYFYIDSSIPEDKRTMLILCENCQKKHPEIKGWFWNGNYGNFDYICNKCGEIIHQKE